jgi:hypothetical protein
MSYYNTLTEDIKRAREILEKGRADWDALMADVPPAVRDRMRASGPGAIFAADIYAAYKLLESFVTAIEQYAGLLRFRKVNPFDHNAECLLCDEQGEHDEGCPWHLVEAMKGYEPHG